MKLLYLKICDKVVDEVWRASSKKSDVQLFNSLWLSEFVEGWDMLRAQVVHHLGGGEFD